MFSDNGPLGYKAYFDGDKRPQPIVAWNQRGQAMIFDTSGQLVVASEQPGFRFAYPGV